MDREDFTTDKQASFRKAIADAAEAAESDVSITNVAAATRRASGDTHVDSSVTVVETEADHVKGKVTVIVENRDALVSLRFCPELQHNQDNMARLSMFVVYV